MMAPISPSYRDGNTGLTGASPLKPSLLRWADILDSRMQFTSGLNSHSPANRTWNGMLDDVAVFNIALSQSQIQTVMAGNFSAFLPQPQLSISSSSTNVVLSWPAAQSAFQLQFTANLAPASWTNVTNALVQSGSRLTVTLPIGSGKQFFRLIGP